MERGTKEIKGRGRQGVDVRGRKYSWKERKLWKRFNSCAYFINITESATFDRQTSDKHKNHKKRKITFTECNI
jgi:hypothetical protein